jgi:lipoprotein-anchoring transpeptidase ErfK/SrfK
MVSRRAFLITLAGAPLAACNNTHTAALSSEDDYDGWYVGSMPDEPFPIPLVNRSYLPPEYLPQTVSYQGGERPGTGRHQRFLYLVEGNGTATRYAVGVGR